MKDIDFDELDKAVSSLLAPTQIGKKEPAPVSSPKKEAVVPQIEKTEPAKALEDDAAEPVRVNVSSSVKKEEPAPKKAAINISGQEPEKEKEQSPTPVKESTAPAITPRRSGRFMDMVHPDATSKEKQDTSSRIPSKTGVTIRPMSDSIKQESTEAGKPASTGQEPQIAVEANPSNSTKQVWTDPIDNTASGSDDDDNKFNLEDDLEMKPFKDWDLDNVVEDTSAPTTATNESPFLSDAKVEKRPLGAFSDAPSEKAPDMIEVKDRSNQVHATRLAEDDDIFQGEKKIEENPSTQSSPQEMRNEDKLPRELEKDIVAVEAGMVTVNANQVQVQDEAKRQSHSVSNAESIANTPAMSIAKQYKESPEVADDTRNHLFDTNEYHPPISRHGESQSHRYALIWVIIALLLLIATAAGFGYWLYLQI